MRIYQLMKGGTANYKIVGERQWYLPGIRCEFCDATSGTVGLDYPLVDLSKMPGEASYRARVVDLSEFKRLRDALAEYLSEPMLLRPGTGFGR